MAKEGSTVGGMMDAFATSISLCLQFGVPLEDLVKKFTHQRFEPSGMTSNRDIPFAKSVVDYIFRWLGLDVPRRVPQDESAQPRAVGRAGGFQAGPPEEENIRVGQGGRRLGCRQRHTDL